MLGAYTTVSSARAAGTPAPATRRAATQPGTARTTPSASCAEPPVTARRQPRRVGVRALTPWFVRTAPPNPATSASTSVAIPAAKLLKPPLTASSAGTGMPSSSAARPSASGSSRRPVHRVAPRARCSTRRSPSSSSRARSAMSVSAARNPSGPPSTTNPARRSVTTTPPACRPLSSTRTSAPLWRSCHAAASPASPAPTTTTLTPSLAPRPRGGRSRRAP